MKRYLIGLYFWPMIVGTTVILFCLCMLCHAVIVILNRPRDGRWVHRVATLWGRAAFNFTPGWTISVEGQEHLPKDGQAVVIVANHESMSDIWAMYFLGIQFRWLAKKEAFAIPLVGQAMRWAGYVPIERGNRESHKRAMQLAQNILEIGIPMFFFPEGTRSKDGELKPFKAGAFRLAQDSQVPVLPVAIHGAGDLLPKGSGLPGVSQVRVQILPLATAPAPDSDLDEIVEKIREDIARAHARLTASHPASDHR